MNYLGQFSEKDFKDTKIYLFIEEQLANNFTPAELAWLYVNGHLDNIRKTLLVPNAGNNGCFDFSEDGMLYKVNTALSLLRHPEVSSLDEWEKVLEKFDAILEERFYVAHIDNTSYVYAKGE